MRLSRSLLLVFIAMNACQALYGQTTQHFIRDIREQFRLINADTTLRTVYLDQEAFMGFTTDGGGYLKGYFRKDSAVKLVEWTGLSYGNMIREYYLRNNRLIFVYERFESFVQREDDQSLDLSRTILTFEGRYYFHNNRLIEQKRSGKRNFDTGVQDIAKELLANAGSNIKLLSK